MTHTPVLLTIVTGPRHHARAFRLDCVETICATVIDAGVIADSVNLHQTGYAAHGLQIASHTLAGKVLALAAAHAAGIGQAVVDVQPERHQPRIGQQHVSGKDILLGHTIMTEPDMMPLQIFTVAPHVDTIGWQATAGEIIVAIAKIIVGILKPDDVYVLTVDILAEGQMDGSLRIRGG